MIQNIRIKNVALIEEATLEFDKGFNALMGETGAGKSIILEALNFVLGSRADKSLIMSGKDKMFVEAVFSNLSLECLNTLNDLGYDEEDLVISRTLNQEGKSEIRINGNLSSLSILKSITKDLVDSYSQHENTTLLNNKNHLLLLDGGIEELLADNKIKLKNLIQEKNETKKQIQLLCGNGENRERYLELLKYQIDEIESLMPTQEEEDELLERFQVMQNSEKISSTLENVLEFLDSTQFSAITNLKSALRGLANIREINNDFLTAYEKLDSLIYELDDLVSLLKRQSRCLIFNESEFEAIDTRLDKYRDIKKKYGQRISDVLKYLEKSKIEYDNLINSGEKIKQLEEKIVAIDSSALEICKEISNARKSYAKKLEEAVMKELSYLGMKNAKLSFDFVQQDEYNQNGYDDVEILFSANKGEQVKALSKVISGGELSRFMLALKSVIVSCGNIFVFDEIDTGISGETANAVGERIAILSKHNQVILISHLPQVCSMADRFFYVFKTVGDRTISNCKMLDENQIYVELAKLIGGDKQSELGILHAKEMIEKAAKFKANIQIKS